MIKMIMITVMMMMMMVVVAVVVEARFNAMRGVAFERDAFRLRSEAMALPELFSLYKCVLELKNFVKFHQKLSAAQEKLAHQKARKSEVSIFPGTGAQASVASLRIWKNNKLCAMDN